MIFNLREGDLVRVVDIHSCLFYRKCKITKILSSELMLVRSIDSSNESRIIRTHNLVLLNPSKFKLK